MCEHSLAALGGSLWPPLLSGCSPHGAPALLFRAVIGQVPPAELVCSSFVAPRFRSLLKASLWRDEASAASPSSFTLLRPRTHTQLDSPPFQAALSRVGTEEGERNENKVKVQSEEQRGMFNRVLRSFVYEGRSRRSRDLSLRLSLSVHLRILESQGEEQKYKNYFYLKFHFVCFFNTFFSKLHHLSISSSSYQLQWLITNQTANQLVLLFDKTL